MVTFGVVIGRISPINELLWIRPDKCTIFPIVREIARY